MSFSMLSPFNLMDIEEDYFLVKFQSREDFDIVLTYGPWIIFDQYLTIRPWMVDFNSIQAFLSIV